MGQNKDIDLAIQKLYENDQIMLKRICHKEMAKFGGVSQKDFDDFYSRAGKEIAVARKNKKYNPSKGKSPMEFLVGVIRRSVWKEMTYKNRKKRCDVIEIEKDKDGNIIRERKYFPTISLDTPMTDGNNEKTIKDTLQSDFCMDYELPKSFQDEKIEKFLRGLTKTQRKIAEMIMDGFPAIEIKKELKLNDKQYINNFNELKSFKNINILCSDLTMLCGCEEDVKKMSTNKKDCKSDKISIDFIIKKMDRHTIRFDHPLQRDSGQWTPAKKGNLISDILQGNKLLPLIFAEQIINGVPIIWDLDGKQRCTNAYLFFKDGYRVSRNIRRWIIEYQTTKKDDKGNDLLDKKGFPIAVNAEFDIRGKKFSELPDELQDKFLNYTFNYDQYLNCSEEDIGYHIERYNDGKPLTSPQKGITKLGTEYAELVKSISNMSFFRDIGGYKVCEFKNGTIERIIVESIMSANYLDKWGKLDNMCKYIKENSDVAVFDEFEDMVARLEKVVTDNVSDMFNSKDSFLWFGLFAKFVKTGTDDIKFIEFMADFGQSLHSEKIDGISFDDILENSKSTKDKGIVTNKMGHLEKLMEKYLGVKEPNENVNVPVEEFIAKNIGADEHEIKGDMDLYNNSLDTLLESTVKVDSKLRHEKNRYSLLAMMAYSYKEDVDLDEWLEQYAEKNNIFFPDQTKNFLYMKNNFEQYYRNNERSA